MKKLAIFSSIRLKFILFFVLLILIAMQIIGVYFVRELENKLTENFKESIISKINFLTYNLEEEFVKDREEKGAKPLEEDIKNILLENTSADIAEIQVLDKNSRILGTSDKNNQGIVGQRKTDNFVTRALVTGEKIDRLVIDGKNGRTWVTYVPIEVNDQIVGVIYLEGLIERIFDQIGVINNVLITGTAIALALTAILAVFVAQTITKPLSEMKKHAQAMARGNFSRKVKVYGKDEIGQLAQTFNNLTKKLQEEQAKTDSEKRKLSSILAYMTDGVISTDRKGRVILINESAEKMLNVTRETVLSKPIVSLLGLEDQYTFEDLLEEQNSVILDYSKANNPFILRANFSIIQKETGLMNGLIVVLHDITEQEKIELERREFVANVSHELRTPLTTMRSYLEALTEGAWKDEEIAPKFLNVTQNETERMIRLVNDLLQLSKMDSKDYRLEKEWVSFIPYINRVIDRFEISRERGISYVRRFPKQQIYVEIDTDKVTQVLDNIISNAIKYSPNGGKITIKIIMYHEYMEVRISDQGIGIPKASISRIFDRFYRIDKARSRVLGGTGLGLAIAKEMIQAHGGRIWASSIEDKGTTIHFTLPYDRNQEDDFDEI
ncbi:cell wall metabolism sensor histidine kinase WalK [Caldibacillus lycopersici]|uniref:histidine kinase n=1 Tax=Perspicuibacillus lycopersici TaxID=1325689 RepID=A0AAE3IU33_9BACI|nr:cell wall metabolism sensor histidine kinase WalK [Perspicuibacillus lycopersici]MCU9613461.1 cell wall metabolism sensor histidine kinase WalK [Perspicuibacillus lycopersici]